MTKQEIMTRAWELRRQHEGRMTMATALRLAWREARGEKGYTVNLESLRAAVSSYLVTLIRADRDEHGEHKLQILKAALMAPVDSLGIAVLDGKSVGLVKYAARNCNAA